MKNQKFGLKEVLHKCKYCNPFKNFSLSIKSDFSNL